jgi:hypothetical protein
MDVIRRLRYAVHEQTDRDYIAFLGTDIDLATLTVIHWGKASHASELIEKAILACKTVMKPAGISPVEFDEEKCELRARTQRFLGAIAASERHFQILNG